MAKAKAETIVSPIGIAAYSWLNKPDTAFNQNHYKITLMLDKSDKDNETFVNHVNEKHKNASNGSKTKSPIKDGDTSGKEGQEGQWVFTAKSQFQPKLVDAKRNQLSGNLFPMSGDLVRVALGLADYDTGSNAGVSLRLKAVQLVEKRNKGGDASDMFDDIDDGFVDDGGSDQDEDDF